MTQAAQSQVPAATRALLVLRSLASAPGPMSANAIASACGMPRSTTYHLLTAMSDQGFVVHFPEDRRWGLGVASFEIGSAYLRHDPLERMARPLLQRLVAEVTQVPVVAHLAVLHGRETLYLLKESSRSGRPVTLVTDVGVRLPAHLTASGRALLAGLPSAQVRALFPDARAFVDRTGSGPSSLSSLRMLLNAQRHDEAFSEHDEVTVGYASVAAAAHDREGRPVASVGLTYEHRDVGERQQRVLARAVGATAEELTRRLTGARPSRGTVGAS